MIFVYKVIINVAINGVAMSSKEIAVVGKTTYLYTSPMAVGYPPATGVIKDVTVTNSNNIFSGE